VIRARGTVPGLAVIAGPFPARPGPRGAAACQCGNAKADQGHDGDMRDGMVGAQDTRHDGLAQTDAASLRNRAPHKAGDIALTLRKTCQ